MVLSLLCLIFISSIHFVPNFLAPFTYILLGPILATLDTGSLNLIICNQKQRPTCQLHSQQQQQQHVSILLIGKYLSFYKGWGNLFAGAIFGLVLLLSHLNPGQTFYQGLHSSQPFNNVSLHFSQSDNLTQVQNDSVLMFQSLNLTVQQDSSHVTSGLNEPQKSYNVKFYNKVSLAYLPKEILHQSKSSSNLVYQVHRVKHSSLYFVIIILMRLAREGVIYVWTTNGKIMAM